MPKSIRAARRIALSLFLGAYGLACGARTGLLTEGDGFGNFIPTDGGVNGRVDGAVDGDISDAPSLVDVRPVIDADRTDCPDASALLIYTITESYELQSFNPDTGQ